MNIFISLDQPEPKKKQQKPFDRPVVKCTILIEFICAGDGVMVMGNRVNPMTVNTEKYMQV